MLAQIVKTAVIAEYEALSAPIIAFFNSSEHNTQIIFVILMASLGLNMALLVLISIRKFC